MDLFLILIHHFSFYFVINRFEVKIDAYPRATVRWYLNGKEIQPSKDFCVDQLEDGTSILTMCEVFPDDAGELMCEAHNEKGVVTSVVQLNITGKSKL